MLASLVAVLAPLVPSWGVSAGQHGERGAAGAALVEAERAQLFFDAWSSATPEQRAAAQRTLGRLRPAGVAAASPPTPLALARAWRDLVPPGAAPATAPDAQQEALQILADALAPTVVPGCFAARDEGPGEPMRVHVETIGVARPARELEVILWWRPPGEGPASPAPEPVQARRAPAGPDAFAASGFDLFVRAPLSPRPGAWQLAVELVQGERRAFGPPVVVECLLDPAALARATAADTPARQALAREVQLCLETGWRGPAGLSLAELGGQRVDASGALSLLPSLEPDGEQAPTWVWRPHGKLCAVVVLLAPGRAPPSAVLGGELGRAWRGLAARTGALLVPWSLASGAAGPRGTFDVLAARLERLQPGAARLPRLLVARGDSPVYLALAVDAQDPPFDGWVLSWSGSARPRLKWPHTAALVLASEGPLAAAALDDATPKLRWQRGAGSAFLDEARFPELVAELAAALVPPREPLGR